MNQSVISDKVQLLQILLQISVKVWDKSRKVIDKSFFSRVLKKKGAIRLFGVNLLTLRRSPHACATSGGADGWDTIHTGVFWTLWF